MKTVADRIPNTVTVAGYYLKRVATWGEGSCKKLHGGTHVLPIAVNSRQAVCKLGLLGSLSPLAASARKPIRGAGARRARTNLQECVQEVGVFLIYGGAVRRVVPAPAHSRVAGILLGLKWKSACN